MSIDATYRPKALEEIAHRSSSAGYADDRLGPRSWVPMVLGAEVVRLVALG